MADGEDCNPTFQCVSNCTHKDGTVYGFTSNFWISDLPFWFK